jgi:Na+-driven multidrug efflux pump
MRLSTLPCLGAIFQPMHSIINTYYVANLGDIDMLAGYALGNMVYMLASTVGGITAQSCGTLIAQAHGAKDARMCAVFHNR